MAQAPAKKLTLKELSALPRYRGTDEHGDNTYADYSMVDRSQRQLAQWMGGNWQAGFGSLAGMKKLAETYAPDLYKGDNTILDSAAFQRIMLGVRSDLATRGEGQRDRTGFFQNHKSSWQDFIGPAIIALAAGGTLAGAGGAFAGGGAGAGGSTTAAALEAGAAGQTSSAGMVAFGGAAPGATGGLTSSQALGIASGGAAAGAAAGGAAVSGSAPAGAAAPGAVPASAPAAGGLGTLGNLTAKDIVTIGTMLSATAAISGGDVQAPTLPQAPKPADTTPGMPAAQQAMRDQRKRGMGGGRGDTILTSPLGVLSGRQFQPKELLGY